MSKGQIMDEKLINKIKRGLLNFEKRIEETNECYDELGGRYARFSAGAPYFYKHLLPFWMCLLEEEGVDCEVFRNEYVRITRKLEALERKRGRDYRNKLLERLKDDVDFYPVVIYGFGELEPYELEIPNDLSTRTAIEIYLMELENDYDLTDIKEKVSTLDESLKSKYMQNIEEILETYFDAEDPYSPDSFWWKHPFKLLKEKQARENNS
jgi:hypothetical protein